MRSLKTIILILILLLSISACSTDLEPVEEAATLPATEVAVVAEATTTEPPEAPAETAVPPTATMLPTAAPTEPPPEPTATMLPTPFVIEMDNCQSCHSDKDMLTDTADPVVEEESSESSGVG